MPITKVHFIKLNNYKKKNQKQKTKTKPRDQGQRQFQCNDTSVFHCTREKEYLKVPLSTGPLFFIQKDILVILP